MAGCQRGLFIVVGELSTYCRSPQADSVQPSIQYIVPRHDVSWRCVCIYCRQLQLYMPHVACAHMCTWPRRSADTACTASTGCCLHAQHTDRFHPSNMLLTMRGGSQGSRNMYPVAANNSDLHRMSWPMAVLTLIDFTRFSSRHETCSWLQA